MPPISKAYLARTYGVPGHRSVRQLNRYDRMPAAHREAYANAFSFQNSQKTYAKALNPRKRNKYHGKLNRSELKAMFAKEASGKKGKRKQSKKGK